MVLMVLMILMIWVVLILMILILAGQEGQMALRTLVGIMSLGTAFEAGDFFQWFMNNSLQPLAVIIVAIGRWFDIAKCTISRFFLSLSGFSLL